jgi:hypothetical protein
MTGGLFGGMQPLWLKGHNLMVRLYPCLLPVGDSRCVLSRKGQAIALTLDHKPILFEEARRIIKAGGFVRDNRINGALNVSRTIGDLDFKRNVELPPSEQMVRWPEASMGGAMHAAAMRAGLTLRSYALWCACSGVVCPRSLMWPLCGAADLEGARARRGSPQGPCFT